jgi:hypothetical protein
VKGFRYELWCLGRSSGARFCCVFCPEAGSSSSSSSSSSADAETDKDRSGSGHVGRWPRALFDDLAARVEPPDPRNRWEQPLFLSDARRAKSEKGEGERVAAAPLRPAPASLPAGGRGSAIEETRGWPLDAVAAAVVAAVASPGGAARKKREESDVVAAAAAAAAAEKNSSSSSAETSYLPEDTLPLATTSVALRPAKCTLAARVAGADALGDLDAAAQGVLLAVAAALSKSGGTGAGAEAAAFAAIEIPLLDDNDNANGDDKGSDRERRSGSDPLTLSLRRAPSLAELRRHKRDFLRAATAPMAGPLPRGARAGASTFCEYLKRRVV